MSRKTIGVTKGLKVMLTEISEEGESINDVLSRLLDEMDKVDTVEVDSTKINIGLSEDTFQRLNDAKLFSTEAYNSVIFRLIQSQK